MAYDEAGLEWECETRNSASSPHTRGLMAAKCMQPRTIAYIGGFELPDRNAAAHRVLANAKLLREIGFTVILIGVRKGQTQPIAKDEYEGFTSYSLPYPSTTWKWLDRYFQVEQYVTLLRSIPPGCLGAIVFYNEKSLLQFRLRHWAQARDIRVIADITEWYAYSGWGPSKLFKKLDGALRMRVLNRLADGLITTSSYIADYYEARGVSRQRIVNLPTLFDQDTANSLVRSKAASSSLKVGLALTYCGNPFNVGDKKLNGKYLKERLDQTIDVFLDIKDLRPDTRLSIFGVTLEEFLKYYPRYRRRIEECGSSLVFHGRVPNRLLLTEVASSDFTVFFRDINRVTLAGFPTKFAESVTYGTPVITNLSPSIKNYAAPGQNCFLLDLTDVHQSKKTMRLIASLDEQQILRLKRNCLESRLFDFRRHTDAVKRFTDELGL
jgi:glycosyltransferase involved in cell wall biosynthesis